jgi:hypothetical protein
MSGDPIEVESEPKGACGGYYLALVEAIISLNLDLLKLGSSRHTIHHL